MAFKKRIIDKFIIGSWLKYFVLFFIILILIVSIAEIITGLTGNQPTASVINKYIYGLPGFLSKIFPVTCLLASAFALSKQKTTNELTAILAGGFSQKRYILVVMFVASLIACFQFILLSFIEPAVFKHKYSKQISARTLRKEGKFLARSYLGSRRTWYKNEKYFVSFSQYIPQSKTLKKVELYYFGESKLTDSIVAESAVYSEKDKLWKLLNAKITINLNENDFPQIQNKKEHFVQLNEKPKDFKIFESDIKTFDIFLLKNFIDKLKNTGIDATSYSLLLYEKISLSIICLIFALFPLIGLNNPNKRSSSTGKNIGLTLVFAIFYWFTHSAVLNLASTPYLTPFIASFLMPALISIGFYFYWRKKS